MWPPEHVLITGASSGIGRAMALALADAGSARLTLVGRVAERLEPVAALCREQGAETAIGVGDVRDQPGMAAIIENAFASRPVDLLIANAGVSGGSFGGGGDPRAVLATNIDGVLNTVEPALSLMLARGQGQIAVMSSLASFKAFPNAPLYCASKAAVRSYGEALDARLRPKGVAVTVLCPGFIETPMTAANPFSMPFILPPEKAARRLLNGMRRRKARVAFPRRLYAICRLLELLPTGVANNLLALSAARQPAKE